MPFLFWLLSTVFLLGRDKAPGYEEVIQNHIRVIKRKLDAKAKPNTIALPALKDEWIGVEGYYELKVLVVSVRKRVKNRESALRSRKKKREKLEFLTQEKARLLKRVEELERENQRLKELKAKSEESSQRQNLDSGQPNNLDLFLITPPGSPMSLSAFNSPLASSDPNSPGITAFERSNGLGIVVDFTDDSYETTGLVGEF